MRTSNEEDTNNWRWRKYKRILKINLKRNGYEVIEADNGELGVKLALKEKPAIIILDVMLPGIDGFNVCKIIRNEDEKVGIIMLTAKVKIWIK